MERSIEETNIKIKEYNDLIEQEKVLEEDSSKKHGAIVVECASLEQNLQFVKENQKKVPCI